MNEERKTSSDRSYFKELYDIPDYNYGEDREKNSQDIEDVLRSFGRQARTSSEPEPLPEDLINHPPPQAPQLQHTVEQLWNEPAEQQLKEEPLDGEPVASDHAEAASMDDIYAALGDEVRRESRFDSIETRFDFDT